MNTSTQEMRAKVELQERMIVEMAQQHGAIETAIAKISEQV